jgi:hypothetical protein
MRITRALLCAIGTVSLLASTAAPGLTQLASQSGARTVTSSTPVEEEQRAWGQTGTRRQSQRAQAPRPSDPAPAATVSRPWTIEQALPGKPAAARDVPRVSSQGLGRVPLDQGSFGFETQSQFRHDQFSDGRKVPGHEAIRREDPSYFGLSLQVPTNNVPLLPLLSPPQDR